MSVLDCFHSPVVDMDYVFFFFFNMGLFVGHLFEGGDLVAVRKWSLQTAGCEESRLGCRGKAKGSPAVGEDGHRRA